MQRMLVERGPAAEYRAPLRGLPVPAPTRRRGSLDRLSALDTFGKRLKLARLDAGLTQDDLIERMRALGGAEIVRSYVSTLENGTLIPGGEIVRAMALALDVSADYLMLLSDDPHPGRYAPTEIEEIWDDLPDDRREELLAVARALASTEDALKRRRLVEVEHTLLSIEEKSGTEVRRMAEGLIRA